MGCGASKTFQPYPPFSVIVPADVKGKAAEGSASATHVYLIANPRSGGGKGKTASIYVEERCRAAGFTVHLFLTQYAGHARELSSGITAFLNRKDAIASPSAATPAGRIDTNHIIVSVGGDGTAHEVLNGMAYASLSSTALHPLLPLAMIPCGSGNSLMYNVGVFSMEQAVECLIAKSFRRIDILEVSNPEERLPIIPGETTLAPPATPVEFAVAEAPASGTGFVNVDLVREASTPKTGANDILDVPHVTTSGKELVAQYSRRVLYSLNIYAWGLSTAVLESANNLRWCGGAQYNCAAYGELIGNHTYLSAIEWVRPPAPIPISTEAFMATRQQLKDAQDGVSGAGEKERGVPSYPPVTSFPSGVNPLIMIEFQVTCYMGSQMAFCPFAKLDDGLMDICAVAPGNRMELVGVMEAAKDAGRHVLGPKNAAHPAAKPNILYAQAEEVIFRPLSQELIDAWKRGEEINASGTGVVPGSRPDAALAQQRKGVNVHQHAMFGVNIDGELDHLSPARVKVLTRTLPILVAQ